MRHFLLKNTAEYRLETVDDVVKFRQELQKQATKDGYSLSAFAYSEKLVKEHGEVVDNYYIAKATFTVNDSKDPTIPIFGVELPYNAENMIATNTNDDVEENIFD